MLLLEFYSTFQAYVHVLRLHVHAAPGYVLVVRKVQCEVCNNGVLQTKSTLKSIFEFSGNALIYLTSITLNFSYFHASQKNSI